MCIDQENLDERSQQVAIMAKIYEMSIGNLVHLGDGNEHTEAALASIDVLMKGEIGEVIKDGRLLCHTTHDDDGMERRSSDPLDMAVDQQALFAFYGNPWFRFVNTETRVLHLCLELNCYYLAEHGFCKSPHWPYGIPATAVSLSSCSETPSLSPPGSCTNGTHLTLESHPHRMTSPPT